RTDDLAVDHPTVSDLAATVRTCPADGMDPVAVTHESHVGAAHDHGLAAPIRDVLEGAHVDPARGVAAQVGGASGLRVHLVASSVGGSLAADVADGTVTCGRTRVDQSPWYR